MKSEEKILYGTFGLFQVLLDIIGYFWKLFWYCCIFLCTPLKFLPYWIQTLIIRARLISSYVGSNNFHKFSDNLVHSV